MHLSHSVKSHIHDFVTRLLELHSLEERLASFPRNQDEGTNVEALIQSLRANMPMGVLIVHDEMKSRDKRSVAEVRRGVCSGCHLGLAISNLNALKAGTLQRCGSCGRYLYVVDEEKEPTRTNRQCKAATDQPPTDPSE